MKALLIFVLIIFICSSSASAQDQVSPLPSSDIEPKWSEFCPKEFCESLPEVPPVLKSKAALAGAIVLMPVWPLTLPFVAGRLRKINHANLANYWYDRRKDFEKELEICRSGQTDAPMCFLKVREMEDTKNAQLAQQNELKDIKRSVRAIQVRQYQSQFIH